MNIKNIVDFQNDNFDLGYNNNVQKSISSIVSSDILQSKNSDIFPPKFFSAKQILFHMHVFQFHNTLKGCKSIPILDQ